MPAHAVGSQTAQTHCGGLGAGVQRGPGCLSQSRSLTLMLLQGFCEKYSCRAHRSSHLWARDFAPRIFQAKPQFLELCKHLGMLGMQKKKGLRRII